MPRLTTCQRLFQPFAHQILTTWGQGSLCSGHKVFLAIDILPLEPMGCWLEPEVVDLTVGSMDKHILPPKPAPRWKGTPSSGSSALQKGPPLPLIGIFSSKERVLFCWPVCTAWKNENCFDFSTECLKAQCPIWNVAAVGKVMFLELALLEVRFFTWTLGPHIKKEKKRHLF